MAGQPFNYRIDVVNPFTAATQGLQLGASIQQLQQQREDREREIAAAEAERIAKLRQAEALQAETSAFLTNPTAQGVLRLSTMLPKDRADALSKGWEAYGESERKKIVGTAAGISSALLSESPDVGVQQLRTLADAARNGGDEEKAKQYEAYAKTAEIDPKSASLMVMLPLTGTEEGKKAIEAILSARKAPAEIREGEAKATTAEVGAKYADTRQLLEIEEIKNDMDVKRLNSRIYAANAALSREANDLKRQELGIRIDEMVRERDQRVRDKAAEAESTAATLDNTDSTIARILANENLGSALGPIQSRLPTMRESTADVEALIDTLQSQTFLSQVSQMKGTGALTESEGKKLTASIQSLNMMQSEKQFRQNLESIRSLMQQAKNRVQRKYESVAAPTSADVDIDALVNKYLPGGM